MEGLPSSSLLETRLLDPGLAFTAFVGVLCGVWALWALARVVTLLFVLQVHPFALGMSRVPRAPSFPHRIAVSHSLMLVARIAASVASPSLPIRFFSWPASPSACHLPYMRSLVLRLVVSVALFFCWGGCRCRSSCRSQSFRAIHGCVHALRRPAIPTLPPPATHTGLFVWDSGRIIVSKDCSVLPCLLVVERAGGFGMPPAAAPGAAPVNPFAAFGEW